MGSRKGFGDLAFPPLEQIVIALGGGLALVVLAMSMYGGFGDQVGAFNNVLDDIGSSEGISEDLIAARQHMQEGIRFMEEGRYEQANDSFNEARIKFNDTKEGLEAIEDNASEYLKLETCFLNNINVFCEEDDAEQIVIDMTDIAENYRNGAAQIMLAISKYTQNEYTEAENAASAAETLFSTGETIPFHLVFVSEPTFVNIGGTTINYEVTDKYPGTTLYGAVRAAEQGIHATSITFNHLIDAYLRDSDRRAAEVVLVANDELEELITNSVSNYESNMDNIDSQVSNAQDSENSNIDLKQIDENILQATRAHVDQFAAAYGEADDNQDKIEDAACRAIEAHEAAGGRLDDRGQDSSHYNGNLEDSLDFSC